MTFQPAHSLRIPPARRSDAGAPSVYAALSDFRRENSVAPASTAYIEEIPA